MVTDLTVCPQKNRAPLYVTAFSYIGHFNVSYDLLGPKGRIILTEKKQQKTATHHGTTCHLIVI